MDTNSNVGPKLAWRNLALGAAIFLGAALIAQTVAAKADDARETIYPQVEVADSIARQGNGAVREIQREARKLAGPASLSELVRIATEVAAK